uniref:Retrovirus-related Pol polyprotein from transposon 17.6 n=1 Tax=Cajanus cajan TaxID=3821 RepID=A0A151QTF6_CAJCA|nr:Retrovirus-related Pol polyprotein from transposon 17.6 [Cajanus cajan]
MMCLPNEVHTSFITGHANFCYRVMPFGLKNAGATYQRLMDKAFHQQIGRNMEVYVNDMVVKTTSVEAHATDLAEVFSQIRKHNMCLNPEKCIFGVQGGKFLGFMITSRGIEANPEKYKAIIQMTVKDVQRLTRRLVSLSRFIPRLAEKAWPIFTLLEKPKNFEWTNQCEEAFKSFKAGSQSRPPPLLGRGRRRNQHSYSTRALEHQLKFLLVEIDYFTKWIEACPLAKITTENVQKFTWKSIICRFRISHSFETPYTLTYGADALIPVEVGETSHQCQVFNSEQNSQEIVADLDLIDELRDEARIHEEACKLRASRRYNTRVRPRSFRVGDLVRRLLGEARRDTSEGKLEPNWGGPFRVLKDLENGAYRLEELNRKAIPRTWNATHLKFYFS